MNALSCCLRPLPSRVIAASLHRVRSLATAAAIPTFNNNSSDHHYHHQHTPLLSELGKTMPPGHGAKVGSLETFVIPENITNSEENRTLGRDMITVWRRDGILQIAMPPTVQRIKSAAFTASRQFFQKPRNEKVVCVDSQSYAGYIESGEEITDGVADYSEIFTVTKDLPLSDPRVRAKWPCHGPCPWPDIEMKEPIEEYIRWLNGEGEKVLRLIEYGLGVEEGSLAKYTRDGWHHMRVLRFPAAHLTNGKGKDGRGIGSHTDYGLLVMASQDDVGGLFIRPPYKDEKFANWETSAAGLREGDDRWVYVPPVPNVHTVFLGDMMQYLTNDHLVATPHKVGLNTRERFTFAYFHEPSFGAVLRPLEAYKKSLPRNDHGIHYGTHFTNMFMRNYPNRITTQRLIAEDRYNKLNEEELRTVGTV